MAGLPYEEQIRTHHATKPYSIDPFNELNTRKQERDELMVRDFLDSFGRLSASVAERVNERYHRMGRDFA